MYLLSRGSGYPILFIHGIPTSGQLWSGVIDKLAGRYRCHAIDLPGLGKTPQDAQGVNHLPALAGRLERIRKEQKIDQWHVVGHDAGSAVAVHYAYRFEEHVGRLALLSPAVFPELQPFHLFRVIRKPVIGEFLAPVVNAIFWNIVMRYALEQRRSEWREVVADFRGPFSGALGAWRLMSVLRFGDPAEVLASIPAMLPQLRVPTLIFRGTRDRAIPEGFAQRASNLIPGSKVVTVDSGHFIPLHNPQAVAAELLQFFEAAHTDVQIRVPSLPANHLAKRANCSVH